MSIIASTLNCRHRFALAAFGVAACFSFLHAEAATVKISIGKTGVYEISYSELREMGFSQPSAVGITGRGGKSLEVTGALDLSSLNMPVPVLHLNDKLYFYGIGVDAFSFHNSDYYLGGYFTNDGLNIYSSAGYYFLTDDPALVVPISTSPYVHSDSKANAGIAFVSHENDLEQNIHRSGNLFWGERFNNGQPSERTWPLDITGVDSSVPGFFDCVFYAESETEGSLSLATAEVPEVASWNSYAKSTYLTPLPGTSTQVPLTSEGNSLTLRYESEDNTGGIAHLDYWVMSYRKSTSEGFSQNASTFAFPDIQSPTEVALPAGFPAIAIDVTPGSAPTLLEAKEGCVTVSRREDGAVPQVVIFNPELPQLKTQFVGDVARTSLRERAAEGADLIIIAPERFLRYADEIAELHRNHDGSKVITATIEDVYDEFSDGLPHPAAYRSLVKLAMQSAAVPLKNILLIGPCASDARGMAQQRDPYSHHIVFQAAKVHGERGAYPAAAYYGMTSDNLNAAKLEKEKVNIGVGWLPFENDADAANYISKIERYLNHTNHAMTVADFLYVGGLYEDHTHEKQCTSLAANLAKGNSVINSVVAVDAYGNEKASAKFVDYLNTGKSLFIYFGHASEMMYGKDTKFFTKADALKLTNQYLPFAFTAGCSTTKCDEGVRGISESLVVGSRHGAIGGMVSLCDTWSNSNASLVTAFTGNMLDPEKALDAAGSRPLSIGEIYAATLSKSNNENDLSYLLMCDPALVVPMPLRKIALAIEENPVPGNRISLAGTITDGNGKIDSDFSGNVVIKLAEPAVTLESDDLETGKANNTAILKVTYGDKIASIASAAVENGRFSLSMTLPEYFSSFNAGECVAYASAFSPEHFLGASGNASLPSFSSAQQPGTAADVVPPVIEDFFYDHDNVTLMLTASDNRGINLSNASPSQSPKLWIDGKMRKSLSLTVTGIDNGDGQCILSATLPPLSEGNHTASVEISDFAGNKTREEITFTVGPLPGEALSLQLLQTAVNEEGLFIHPSPEKASEIVIFSASGKIIRRLAADSSGQTNWQRDDERGERVAPGLYKAILVEKDHSADANRNSRTIYVPVV